jgi:hypothetical protein
MTTTEAETATVYAPGATPKLNKALSQLQGELPRIKKTKTGKVEGENKAGKFFSYEYSYADLGDVVADVGPLLAKFGLAFCCAPTINPADRREMIMPWSLLHESGEEKTGEWPLGPVNQKPQALGSAITYGRRYAFTAATNIVLEDDDDGQRAQQDHGSRQSAGDVWDKATPAPPRQDRKAERSHGTPDDDPFYTQDPPEDSRPWADTAIEQAKAGKFKTEAEAWKLWREAAQPGKCTPKQQDEIQNRVAAWIKGRRREASSLLLRQLPESAADWKAAIEGLDGDDIGACRETLEEIGRLKGAGNMNETLAGRIGRAIIALCPKAGIKDTEAAA